MRDTVTEEDRCWAYRIVWTDLPFCGCGNPDAVYDLVRRLLKTAEAGENLRSLLPEDEGVAYLVLYALDKAELTEHGSSCHYSWLTDKGKWFLRVTDGLALDDLPGFPEDETVPPPWEAGRVDAGSDTPHP